MKILLLTKFSTAEHHLFEFTQKINNVLPLEVDILRVVNAYPQVPLKPDGSIIDPCVDYDLSALTDQKLSELAIANEFKAKFPFIQAPMVEIGNLEKIVRYKIVKKGYDLILMGGHQTTLIEDLTHESTVTRIMELSDLPVLSVKFEQSSHSELNKIGIFDDFNFKKPRKLSALIQIAKAFHAEVHLFRMSGGKGGSLNGHDEVMKNFAMENELSDFHIHNLPLDGKNEESVIAENIQKENLQLIAIPELHRKTISWMMSKNIKASIADHVLAPLLIY
ncbi:universal stress protein [Flexithrix dorotheae]|uniref:universal stress protein n=1 Tax=Flexithrix dorotheae TaxID=70993 RepID=UPI0003729CD8|nr:universal stress protein [Flexithrix dorotheae]